MEGTSGHADRKVHVLRHAKSSWKDASLSDHDRPLAPRGRRAAARVGEYARENGIRPELILCSSAIRARETFELIAPSIAGGAEVQVERALYGATEGELLGRLRAVPEEVRSVMLIGHNPGVQDLVLMLAREGPLRANAEEKFPTAALATLTVNVTGWEKLEEGGGELVDFVVPRRLG